MLVGAALVLSFLPVGAWAQTGTGSSTQLTARDQKIAQALFEAQTNKTGSAPLTLEQIVAMKRDHKGHEGWGEVFKDMKAQGLLTQKNLGQVVKDYERHHPETARVGRADKPDKPGKPERMERMDKPDRPEKPGR
jgi:hypothetical protein